MNNLFRNMQDFLNKFNRFIKDPIQSMMELNLNIPQQYRDNPLGATQYLMNTGMMNQQQYNLLQQIANQIQQNPQFQQVFQPNKRIQGQK